MPSFEEVKVGDIIPSVQVVMDREMYKNYNRLVNEVNPLHFNEKYAQNLGFKTIVVAGVFTYSFFLQPILDWTKDPDCIKTIKIRFHQPIYIEDQITQGAIITKKYIKEGEKYIECDIWVENQKKENVTTGSAIFTINP
ncbi:MAG TPA: MaoC/PaaZ C-terminal domain-containing protein [Candidatus Deferrimicrobium sp.]|nr:MaoC/PaaZ C-terminal domain-containing protein [Candidatus Deferrimicrobium sp.]